LLTTTPYLRRNLGSEGLLSLILCRRPSFLFDLTIWLAPTLRSFGHSHVQRKISSQNAKMFLATIKLFSFLINPEFWARTGFFVGYIIAFLLVLEVVRLASTDANRKEVEKLLDAYAASRSDVPVRRRREEAAPVKKVVQVSIDELEDMERRSVIAEQERQTQEHQQREQERTRTPSPAAARIPESKHTEEKRRRRTTSTSVSPHATSQSHSHPQTTSSSSPTRRLRKRSDTLNSSSSAEAKGTAVRRRRETSPIESKTRESRHASPTPRSRSKEAKILGGSLGKMLRSRG